MWFKRKPKLGDRNQVIADDTAVLTDKTLIEANVKAFGALIVQFDAAEGVKVKLAALADKYQYVSPKRDPDAYRKDEKIRDRIDDIRLAAAKALKTGDFSDVEREIEKIKILIAER
jgi:hypothetical protein